ncbi:MAG: glycosyltransferase family 39 protein [Mariprofundaceae bacterium]
MIAEKHGRGFVALWFVLALATLGLAPLFDYDETVYAQTALDMMRHGHWLVPEANGMRFFEKPPFVYYLMDGSFALFGENAWAARLPSALFTLATSLLLVWAGRRIKDAALGWMAAAIFLSLFQVGFLAHAAILDPALNFFLAGSLLGWMLWRRDGRRRDALMAALCSGLAVSVKGPVGLVLPAAVAALDLWLDRRARPWRGLPWAGMTALFLAAALPWYLMLLIANGPAFLRDFIWVHNIGRALHPMQGHGGGWHYYLVVFAVGVLPWLAWLPWLARRWTTMLREDGPDAGIVRIGLLWIGLVLLIFSLAQTKLPHYISSIWPAVALIAALALREGLPARTNGIRAGTLATLAPIGLFVAALPWLWQGLSGLVHHPRARAILEQPLAPDWGVALAGLALLAALGWFALGRARCLPLRTLALGLVLQLTLLIGLGRFAGELVQGPLMRIAEQARALPADAPLLALYLNAPSVSFYSGRNYRMVEPAELARMAAEGRAFAVFLRTESRPALEAALKQTLPGGIPAPVVNAGGYLLYCVGAR